MEESSIELNDIKYEVKSLIEFSSLAKLLFELSKRQKNIEQNIISIKSLINEKDNRLINLEKKVLGEIQQEKNISGIEQTPIINKNEINFESQNKEKNSGDKKNDSINITKELDNDNNFNIDMNKEKNNEDFQNINENNNDKKNKNENDNENNEEKEDHLENNNNNDNNKDREKIEKDKDEINKNMDNKNNTSNIINDATNLGADRTKKKDENNNNNKESTFDGKEKIKEIKLEPEMISKLFRKVNELEKKINIINEKTNKDISPKIQTSLDNINNINNQIEKYDKNFEEIDKKIVKFQEEFDKIKIEIEDFNINNIFKNESSQGNNVDMNTALIQVLEKKIFKKFDLYDEKNKKNEEDIFKNTENLKNLKALIDNMKNIIQRNSDKIKENENNFNEYKNKVNENLDRLKNFIELINQQIPKDGIKNNSDKNIKQLEEKLNRLLEKPKDSVIINRNQNNNLEPEILKKFEEFENLFKEIKKYINLIEKDIDTKMNEENKNIYKKITLLEKEVQLKSNLKDLSSINDKIYNLEENIKSLNSHIDNLSQHNEKFKSDIDDILKRLENFEGELFQLKNEKENNFMPKHTGLETNNFLHQSIFTQYKKEINSKLEKIKTDLENLNNNYETLSSTLNLYLNDKDFSKFQNRLMNHIEDFKSSLHRKYMERIEIQKALKVIDNQIKLLNESSKKYEGSDRWLLAKKPIGNFQCASCEANLKDLEQKDNYVPWNKYPSREDKTYRIGHGYSRILEMVNEEIIKNFENKESKGYVSDDDKKSGKSNSKDKNKNKNKLNKSILLTENKYVKLPKVNKKILNLDNSKEKLGNTYNNNLKVSTSPYKVTDISNQEEPKVTKIYKLNNNKNFGFFPTKTDKNNIMNINMNRINKSSTKNKTNYMQMNLTMPDNN